MNIDKLIHVRDEDDSKLITLLSEGWKIIQTTSGIYCWVLLRKPNDTKKKIKGFQ